MHIFLDAPRTTPIMCKWSLGISSRCLRLMACLIQYPHNIRSSTFMHFTEPVIKTYSLVEYRRRWKKHHWWINVSKMSNHFYRRHIREKTLNCNRLSSFCMRTCVIGIRNILIMMEASSTDRYAKHFTRVTTIICSRLDATLKVPRIKICMERLLVSRVCILW